MRFHFRDQKLLKLYKTEAGAKKYPSSVVDSFFIVMDVIKNAKNLNDLYQLKSLHFEKLKGKRKHQRSLRLDRKWRLIIEVIKDEEDHEVIIVSIDKHYND